MVQKIPAYKKLTNGFTRYKKLTFSLHKWFIRSLFGC